MISSSNEFVSKKINSIWPETSNVAFYNYRTMVKENHLNSYIGTKGLHISLLQEHRGCFFKVM